MTRRSFVRAGAAVAGTAQGAGVLAACGSSDSAPAATTVAEAAAAPPVSNGAAALERLLAGNQRFTGASPAAPRRNVARSAELVDHQAPFAVILGCADSRVTPEIVFDEGIGDLFDIRVAGNTAVDPVVLGSVEYGASVLGSVLVMVLGHQNCGAVTAAVDKVRKGKTAPGHIPALVDPIVPAVRAVADEPADRVVEAAIKENVRRQVRLLESSTPILAELVSNGKLDVAGGEYRIETGAVERIV